MTDLLFKMRVWKFITCLMVFIVLAPLLARAVASEKNHSNQNNNMLFKRKVLGIQRILFLRIKYPGDNGGTLSDSQIIEHSNQLKVGYSTGSYGKVDVQIDIPPMLTMPRPDTYYADPGSRLKVRNDAVLLAEKLGYDIDSYDNEVVFSRQVWGGRQSLGTLNVRTTLLGATGVHVTAHELGHAYQWHHADFWLVSSGSPISSTGKSINYGDNFDIMGNGFSGIFTTTDNLFHHFHPWLKYRVGWIESDNLLTVNKSGSYKIQALETTPQAGVNTALIIRRDPESDYWIFFRSSEEEVDYGPLITLVRNNNYSSTLLYDMHPGSQRVEDDWRDAALGIDETFTDGQNSISVKTTSVNSNEVTVDVTIDENRQTSVDLLPVIDFVAPLAGETATGNVHYEVTAFDPDAGSLNGQGIQSVTFFLSGVSDVLFSKLNKKLDPPRPYFVREVTLPPYACEIDTDALLNLDSQYFMVAKAVGENGGVKYMWLEHFIDNTNIVASPSLVSPLDAAASQPTDVILQWNASPAATSYELQLSIDSGFISFVADEKGLKNTQLQMFGLTDNAQFFWRVRARNAVGAGKWSPLRSFTTGVSASAAPLLLLPEDGAGDIPVQQNLTWQAAVDAQSYHLQVSTLSDFSSLKIEQSQINGTSYQLSALDNAIQYYWRVRGENVSGFGLWSQVRNFTTIIDLPNSPELLSPANGATDVSVATEVMWKVSDRAASYHVQVSVSNDFSTIHVEKDGISELRQNLDTLAEATTYYWRVQAINVAGESDWSPAWGFTTGKPNSVNDGDDVLPEEIVLNQNYPNPFNPETTITFSIPKNEMVRLAIFDISGKFVRELTHGRLSAGKHSFVFDASNVASGVYFYQLSAGKSVRFKKMLLLR